MPNRFLAPAALSLAALLLAGCASDQLLGPNGGVTTSALTPPANPACVSLASQIDTLRGEGIADKIEKAAAKKYKMNAADLSKADQLTKANADFQAKCSTLPAKPAVAAQPGGGATQVATAPKGSGASGPNAAPAPKGPPVSTLSASSGPSKQ